MLKKTLQKGFTLIELMVVVSIIGILMAAGILAFSNAQQTARDAKRKADIDAISKAEEQYNSQNGSYPLAANITSAITSYFPAGYLPVDPQNAGAFVYTVTASAANPNLAYCACAKLEKATGNATTAGAAGVCAWVTAANAGTGGFQCAAQRQ